MGDGTEFDKDDDELLTAWRAGDTRAGERLYLRHEDRVYRFFRTKLNDLAAVEDLVQETFLVLAKGSEFRKEARVTTFLLGIARNKLLTHYRKQKRNKQLGDKVEEQSAVALSNPGAFTLLEGKHNQRLLLEALRRLPLDRQILMELYYWEDLSNTEIAEVLGIPPATVRSRLARTKEKLAKALAAMTHADLKTTETTLESWASSVGLELSKSMGEQRA